MIWNDIILHTRRWEISAELLIIISDHHRTLLLLYRLHFVLQQQLAGDSPLMTCSLYLLNMCVHHHILVYIFSSGLYSPGGAYVYDSSVLSMHIAATTALPIFLFSLFCFILIWKTTKKKWWTDGGPFSSCAPQNKKR